jgi:hypothetical protein
MTTEPSQSSGDAILSPATLATAISREDGYPSSTKATIDSVNSSRHSHDTSYYTRSSIPSNFGSNDIEAMT